MLLKVKAKDGTGRMNAALRILMGLRARNLANEVGDLVVAQTQYRFDRSKRAPDGSRWAKWSPAYARSRLRRSTPGGVLSLFGWLRRSIDSRVSNWGGINRANLNVGPTGEEVAAYADVQQFGSRKKSGKNTPAREYLGLSERDGEAVENLVHKNMRRALGW